VTDADTYLREFEAFIQRFGKHYTATERSRRFAVFKSNYDIMERSNAQNHSYKLGITPFADLTPEEFAAMYGGTEPLSPRLSEVHDLPFLGTYVGSNLSVPQSVDWRTAGAVSPVKSQGMCGSCWTFGASAAIEGAWKIATGQLVSLSEQQILDCTADKPGYHGCKGGSIQGAIQYAVNARLSNEASYPYVARVGTCQEGKGNVVIPKGGVLGYKNLRPDDEQLLLEAVAQQPVAVAVEADQNVFQLYRGGVLTSDACGRKLDHAVTIVGYGTEKGQDYWLIKNSWGPLWGDKGYMRLARGKKDGGECGLASAPVIAIVDGSKAKPIDIKATIIAASSACAILCALGIYCMVRNKLGWGRSRGAAPPLLVQESQPRQVVPASRANATGGHRLGGARRPDGARVVSPVLLAQQTQQAQAQASQV